MDDWKEFKKVNYKKNVVAQSEWGTIYFGIDSLKEVAGGERLNYEEYLEIQRNSGKNVRHYFEACYYNFPLGFRGQIAKRTKDKVCFNRIFVEGMFPDGMCFDGKEDHVWMSLKGFEEYHEGDSLSFFADIYRYLKTGKGKSIDFGLRNPKGIKKIPDYELPSDDDLMKQEIEQIVCDACFLGEQCSMGMCLLPKGKKRAKINALYEELKKAGAQKARQGGS